MSHLKIDINEIKKNIDCIKKSVGEARNLGVKTSILLENKVFDDYPDIYEKYPWVVKHICQGKDENYLNKMIDALEKVSKGEKTVQQAGKEIGEELAEKYIYPQFGKPNEK